MSQTLTATPPAAARFGALLRYFRSAANLSQHELAERSRLSVEAISLLERGLRRAPQRRTLQLLVAGLGLACGQAAALEAAAAAGRGAPPRLGRRSVKGNLPAEWAPLIGRERELGGIAAALRGGRLVSLTGSGGIGKTRCAIAAGTSGRDDWSDGVWFAELASVDGSAGVPGTVAAVLGVRDSGARGALSAIVSRLKNRRLLLILDNCEHVLAGARALCVEVLRECPRVAILTTSREALNIDGETVIRVPSLDVPCGRLAGVDDARRYAAIELFCRRAEASDARFRLTAENVAVVADICSRLDGVPLAIELAAARIRVFSVNALARSLGERFGLLADGRRSRPPRHQTMHALIDWSYDLLTQPERTIFRRLAIFAGGFSLDLALKVCADERLAEADVLELLSSLVEKSLVHVDAGDDERRYRLFETTRERAGEKLAEHGERHDMASRHARAYLELAQHLEMAWERTPENRWHAAVGPEFENWRAALTWSLHGRRDVVLGQRLAAALRFAWHFCLPAEGERWIVAASDAIGAGTPADVVAGLALARAHVSGIVDRYETSLEAGRRALAHFEELGDDWRAAWARRQTGRALAFTGELAAAQNLLQHALPNIRQTNRPILLAYVLLSLGLVRIRLADFAGARRCYGEALALCQAGGHERGAVNALCGLAEIAFTDGDAVAALAFSEAALASDTATDPGFFLPLILCDRAAFLTYAGRFDEAVAAARESLIAAREHEARVPTAWAIQHLAAAALLRARAVTGPGTAAIVESCARLAGFADGAAVALGAKRTYTEQQGRDAAQAALEAVLDAAALAELLAQGRSWSEEFAAAKALELARATA